MTHGPSTHAAGHHEPPRSWDRLALAVARPTDLDSAALHSDAPPPQEALDGYHGSNEGRAVPRPLALGGARRRLAPTAVRNLERAGVPRSTAMKMVGNKTEAIYRRHAIVDEAMLQEGAEKLDRLQAEAARKALVAHWARRSP
jgi:hypothetical protein